ncbi:PEPxxWA-CTERM sorting domain-containing protein [Phenylobacterium sp.]|uniref:PEPxxWA-CTERM sorting domain-containing protein n=1 Tax=Phenylobacterium sp. TaxID=1871053 RepID=UPI00301C707D
MIGRKLLAAAAAATVLMGATAANAALVFVGAWSVYHDDAPEWSGSPPNGPLAYTGQEAAALLFGGNAGDYVISTVSDQVADIDFLAWYDVIGVGGNKFAQDYSSKYLGLYYGPTDTYGSTLDGAASAFIRDNLDASYINYAFRDDSLGGGAGAIPEPATWALMIGGFGLAGSALRRRRAAFA